MLKISEHVPKLNESKSMIRVSRFLEAALKKCAFCSPDPILKILSSKNFFVLHDPFAILPGHLLITSKEHYSCLAEAVVHHFEEYQQVLSQAKFLIKSKFGVLCRFEHGRAGHCFSRDPDSRFCHHYHEHLIPAIVDPTQYLMEKFRSYTFEDEKQLNPLFEKYGNYLLFETNEGEKRFYVVDHVEIPPHFLRTIVTTQLGFPERQKWEEYTSCEFLIEGKNFFSEKAIS